MNWSYSSYLHFWLLNPRPFPSASPNLLAAALTEATTSGTPSALFVEGPEALFGSFSSVTWNVWNMVSLDKHTVNTYHIWWNAFVLSCFIQLSVTFEILTVFEHASSVSSFKAMVSPMISRTFTSPTVPISHLGEWNMGWDLDATYWMSWVTGSEH